MPKTSRIFNITAANVVLKNINFINAYSYNINAGAIYLNADNASFLIADLKTTVLFMVEVQVFTWK